MKEIVNAGIKNGAFPGAVAMIGELLPPFYQLTLIRTNEQKDTKELKKIDCKKGIMED